MKSLSVWTWAASAAFLATAGMTAQAEAQNRGQGYAAVDVGVLGGGCADDDAIDNGWVCSDGGLELGLNVGWTKSFRDKWFFGGEVGLRYGLGPAEYMASPELTGATVRARVLAVTDASDEAIEGGLAEGDEGEVFMVTMPAADTDPAQVTLFEADNLGYHAAFVVGGVFDVGRPGGYAATGVFKLGYGTKDGISGTAVEYSRTAGAARGVTLPAPDTGSDGIYLFLGGGIQSGDSWSALLGYEMWDADSQVVVRFGKTF